MAGRKIASWVSIFSMVFSMACGGSSSGTSGSPAAISDISDLPRATSAVVDSTSASLASMRGVEPNFAESGKVLSEVDASSFDGDSSMAMCLTTQSLKQSIKNMSFADMVLCYMQSSLTDDVNSGVGADLYDGNPHIFRGNFENEPEGGGPGENFIIKMQVTKTGDAITDFKMWSCTEGVQTDYINYSNTVDGLSIVTKSAFSGDHTGVQIATVSGALDSDLNFTAKNLVTQYTSTGEEGTNRGQTTFDQGFDTATLSSAEAGNFDFGEDSGTYNNKTYAVAELLSPDSMATIAIGDGAAQYLMTGTHSDSDYEDSGTQAWDGDTTAIADTNDFVALAEAGILDDVPEEADITTTATFTGDEVFDCDDTTAEDLTIDFESESVTVCNDINSVSADYMDCWGTIENGGGEFDQIHSDYTRQCTDVSECGAIADLEMAICADRGGAEQFCGSLCTTADDCAVYGPGVDCVDAGDVNFCGYTCETDDDCTGYENASRCDEGLHVCIQPA